MYDWRGKFIEYDDDEPTIRTHCKRCGAFLPRKPQEYQRSIPSKWEQAYDDQGNIATFTILEEEIELECQWVCSRCGYGHDESEMWG
jgi:ribosomal protein S27AE